MCSLDITSLYSNIPVAETIDLILYNIYTIGILVFKDISGENFRKLLQFALSNTYFKFNGKIYTEKEGLATGAPPSPTFANIFLSYFGTQCLVACSDNLKPTYSFIWIK